MSTSDDRVRAESTEAALAALERTVERGLRAIAQMERALREARERRDEVERLLAQLADGEENPARMQQRIQALTAENTELRRRIDEGREGVERLLARIRVLEEQR